MWETEAEWQRLMRDLARWRTRRLAADGLGQHRSQLEAACVLLERVLAELHTAMASAPATTMPDTWRVHDRRLAWVQRVWEFFRERFDQRDDEALAPVLRGADEVVWSCHREPFAALVTPGASVDEPPPLPYLEPSLTPEVFPHGLVPGALRRDIDAPFLRKALEQLPFPVVRVPASCATAPWWLVHLGHEVGHVVDARLLGYQARTALVAAVGLPTASTDEWTRWSGETFADAYAVLMHGPWALWALGTAEAHADEAMRQPRDDYPPPVVRLLVAAHACRTLGASLGDVRAEIETWEALAGADAATTARVADGRRVVDALLSAPVRRLAWSQLAAWEPAAWTRQGLLPWTTAMARRPAAAPGKPRRAWARALVAGAVQRRRAADRTADAFDGDALGDDLLTWLPAVREPGTRATATVASRVIAAQGDALARALMDAEPV